MVGVVGFAVISAVVIEGTGEDLGEGEWQQLSFSPDDASTLRPTVAFAFL